MADCNPAFDVAIDVNALNTIPRFNESAGTMDEQIEVVNDEFLPGIMQTIDKTYHLVREMHPVFEIPFKYEKLLEIGGNEMLIPSLCVLFMGIVNAIKARGWACSLVINEPAKILKVKIT